MIGTRKPKKLRKVATAIFALAFTLAGVDIASASTDVASWSDLSTAMSTGSGDIKVTGAFTADSIISTAAANIIDLNNQVLTGGSGTGIVSTGALTINNGGQLVSFTNPTANQSILTVNGADLTISDGSLSFTDNTANWGALGVVSGAVNANVDSIVFEGNKSATHGAGFYYKDQAGTAGATFTATGDITFKNNEVTSSATSGSGAGVFVAGGNTSFLGANNTFDGNKMNATIAEGRKYKTGGGAIANQSYENETTHDAINAEMVIGNANSSNLFTNNTSSTNGGAIMNRAVDDDGNATLTINGTSEFTNNTAAQKGGAIYNIGRNGHTATVNINGAATFTGNKANGVDNDIYNEGGIINLNAGEGKTISLAGGIDGDGAISVAKNVVNVNSGKVAVSNVYNQTLNVNGGELHLSTTATDASNLSGSYVYVKNGATINTIDNVINDYAKTDDSEFKHTVNLLGGAIVKGDIDFTNGVADKYLGVDGSSITYAMGNIIDTGDLSGDPKFVSVTTDGVTVNKSTTFEWYGGEDKGLALTGSGKNDGKIKLYVGSGLDSLINDTTDEGEQSTKVFNFTANVEHNSTGADAIIKNSDFTITGDGTAAASHTLTLNQNLTVGDNTETSTLTINDAKVAGAGDLIIAAGSTANINDSAIGAYVRNYGTLNSDPTTYEGGMANYRGAIATITGDTFQNITRAGQNGGAIFNEGAVGTDPAGQLTLNNVTFNANSAANGAALYNLGTATINGGTFTNNTATALGGAIYSGADLTINSTATNSVVFSGNKANGVDNDIYMFGTDDTTRVTLNLNAKDDTNIISLAGGVDGQYYDVNINGATGNAGTVNVNGIKGATNTTINAGTVSNTGLIDSNLVDIKSGATLITAGVDDTTTPTTGLDAAVKMRYNDATLNLTGGTINNHINFNPSTAMFGTAGKILLSDDVNIADGVLIGANNIDLGGKTLQLNGDGDILADYAVNGTIKGTDKTDDTTLQLSHDGTTAIDITSLGVEDIHTLQFGGKYKVDATKISNLARDIKLFSDAEITLVGTSNANSFENSSSSSQGSVIIAQTMTNTGKFSNQNLTINQKDASDNDITFTTDAANLATVNAVDNDGKLVLTGTGDSGKLASSVSGDGALQIGDGTNAANISTNHHNITQSTGGITISSISSDYTNWLDVNSGDTVTGDVSVGNYAKYYISGSHDGDVTLTTGNSFLYLSDSASSVSGDVISDNGGTIKIDNFSEDTRLSQITGDIKGSSGNGNYKILASGGLTHTAYIDKAISGATSVTAEYGQVAMTDVAYESMNSAIAVGDDVELTLDNTKEGEHAYVNSTISPESAGDIYTLNIENSNATAEGTTIIQKAITGAGEININSGHAEFNANVTTTDGSGGNGTVNVDDNAYLAVKSGKTLTADVDATGDLVVDEGTVAGDVTLEASSTYLSLYDGYSITGDVISDNDSNIRVFALTSDSALSQIEGDIKGSADNGQYVISGISADDHTAYIDKAIAGATEIDVDGNVKITNTAYTTTSADIIAESGTNLTLENTSASSVDFDNTIEGYDAGLGNEKYTLNIANTNETPGTTVIKGAITDATAITATTGIVDLQADVTTTNAAGDDKGTYTVNAVAETDLTSGTLTANVTNHGTFKFKGGTLNGSYSTDGGETDVDYNLTLGDGTSITGGILQISEGAKLTLNATDVDKATIAATTTKIIGDFDILSGSVTLDGGTGYGNVDWQGDVLLNGDKAKLTLRHIIDKQRVYDPSTGTYGTFNKTGKLTAQKGILDIDNTNVLLGDQDVIEKDVDLRLSGDLTVTQSANVTIDEDDTWSAGGILLEDDGQFTFDNYALNSTAAKSYNQTGGDLALKDSTIILNAGSSVTGGTVDMDNSSFTFANGVENSAQISMDDATSSLTVRGIDEDNTTTLNLLAGTAIDYGTVTIGDGNNANEVTIAGTSSTDNSYISEDAIVNLRANAKLTVDDNAAVALDNYTGSTDTWTGEVSLQGGTLYYDGLTENGKLTADSGNLYVGRDGNGGTLNIASGSYIDKDVYTYLKEDATLAIAGGDVDLNGAGTTASPLTADDWEGAVTMSSGTLDLTDGLEHSTSDGSYNQTGGGLALYDTSSLTFDSTDSQITGGEVDLWDYSSLILSNGLDHSAKVVTDDDENPILTINSNSNLTLLDGSEIEQEATTTLASGSTLDISSDSYVELNSDDTWSGDITLNDEDAELYYDNLSTNGKLTATKGSLDIGTMDDGSGDDTVLNIASGSSIAKAVDATVASGSTLAIAGGDVDLNGAGDGSLTPDDWSGAVTMSSGTLDLTDDLDHTTTSALDKYVQTGGTLGIDSASLTLNDDNSQIAGGSVNLKSAGALAIKTTDAVANHALVSTADTSANEFTVGDGTKATEFTLDYGSLVNYEAIATIDDNAQLTNSSGSTLKLDKTEGTSPDTWDGAVINAGNLELTNMTKDDAGLLSQTASTGDTKVLGTDASNIFDMNNANDIISAGNLTIGDGTNATKMDVSAGTIASGAKADLKAGSTLEVNGGNATFDGTTAGTTDTWNGDLVVSGGNMTLKDRNSANADSTDATKTFNQTGGKTQLDNSSLTLNNNTPSSVVTGGTLDLDKSSSMVFQNNTANTAQILANDGTANNLVIGDAAGNTSTSLTTGAASIIDAATLMTIDPTSALNVDGAGTMVSLDANDTWAPDGSVNLTKGSLVYNGRNDSVDVTDPTKPNYTQTGGTLQMENATMTLADAGVVNNAGSAVPLNIEMDEDAVLRVQSGSLNADNISGAGMIDSMDGTTLNKHNVANDMMVYNNSTTPAKDAFGNNYAQDAQAEFTFDIYARSIQTQDNDKFTVGHDLTSNDPTTDATVRVDDFELLGDLNGADAPVDASYNIKFFDVQGNIADNIIFTATDKLVKTPIAYFGLDGNGDGSYNFHIKEWNPEVFRGQVATVAQYANQLNINNILFDHVDLVHQSELIAEGQNANRYASADSVLAPYQYTKEDAGVWFKSYGNFENIQMTEHMDVRNYGYGSIIGVDLSQIDLGKGWKLMPTIYAAYNGGHQTYDNIGIYENGGQAGIMGTFTKGNFIGSILGYGGAYSTRMNGFANDSDDVANWFAGGATKLAYNFKLPLDLYLQPTLLASYNAFGEQNWGTSYGAMSMHSGMLNGINIAPGVNLIWNKETFSIYATAQMMFNIMGGVSGTAGHVDLPEMRMNNAYFEYGLGIRKRFKDRFSGYIQATARAGARLGVGLQAGFDWYLGKDPKKMKAETEASK